MTRFQPRSLAPLPMTPDQTPPAAEHPPGDHIHFPEVEWPEPGPDGGLVGVERGCATVAAPQPDDYDLVIAADRALLELAAKAAGIAVVRSRLHDPACQDFLIRGSARNPSQDFSPWNPLADDGDALRLAVKLYIGVRPHGPDHWQQPNVAVALWDFGDKSGRVTVEHGDDPQRAARRAITRAAAAVGEAMP